MNTNQNSNLYVVTAKVVGGENSHLKTETEGISAYLHAFVLATDALEAGKKVKSALEEDHYTEIKIEEIVESKNLEFEYDGETSYDELKKEAIETNEVVYGPFFVFDNDDE
jgi:hypothetical protein